MNAKVKEILSNFSYSFIANVLSLLISILMVAIVPKAIGITDYGYWQLYVFYSSYVGFFSLGWQDGIYLRYGGKEYESLDKTLFHGQFWMSVILEVLTMFILFFIILIANPGVDKSIILFFTSISCVIVIPKAMLTYTLQATNKIKEYAVITLMERIFYCLLIVIAILMGYTNYKFLIFLDLISKFIALLYGMYICKDIVKANGKGNLSKNFLEAKSNIYVGLQLMLANIAGMLILGIVKLGIESSWSIETFGKISLAMSVSNMLLVFINAIGVVLFPILRRTGHEKLKNIYALMKSSLMIPIIIMLITYFPMKVLLEVWIPQYAESMKYMALMFPICIYESKMSMLTNTYLKTLRKERQMLFINALSVLVSLLTTGIFIYIFESLELVVLSICFLEAFRSILSEIILSKHLDIKIYKDIFLEIMMTILFIVCSWFFSSYIGFTLYFISICIYLLLKKGDIGILIRLAQNFIKNK